LTPVIHRARGSAIKDVLLEFFSVWCDVACEDAARRRRPDRSGRRRIISVE
jgi:hypothetical protein